MWDIRGFALREDRCRLAYMELDQLEDEATPYFTPVATSKLSLFHFGQLDIVKNGVHIKWIYTNLIVA